MRKVWRFSALVLVFGALVFLTGQTASTQAQLFEYFPQTGHTVEGEFLNFYRAIESPEFIYGFPITESFFNPDGVQLQYFQRARFEQLPGQAVSLTAVGRDLYIPGNPLTARAPSTGGCQTFENGFQVCTSFLEFFQEHGGRDQFGLPISNVEKMGDRNVQYFENARMEWYPEGAELGLEIRLALLGQIYFQQMNENPDRLGPIRDSAILEITSLHTHVFSEYATVRRSGEQRIFIIVQDQNFGPIANAPFELNVNFPSGESVTTTGSTNAAGFATASLRLGEIQTQTGLVYLQVFARTQSFEGQARTSFRIVP